MKFTTRNAEFTPSLNMSSQENTSLLSTRVHKSLWFSWETVPSGAAGLRHRAVARASARANTRTPRVTTC